MKANDLKKYNRLLTVCILGIILVIGGAIILNKLLRLPSVYVISDTMPKLIPQERIYRNARYNIQFTWPEDYYVEGKLRESYFLKETSGQVTITNTSYLENGEIRSSYQEVYTFFDANTKDAKDMTLWWRTNITAEIGNGKIPGDYEIKPNRVLFESCIPDWKKPPSLTIIANYKLFEDPMTHSSTYLYYDFGRPFILHFSEISSGACSDYGVISSLKAIL